MGSSDCYETETRVHGRPVPPIATAPAETGRNRGTGREVAVIVTKRKMERYREALDQKGLRNFLQGAGLLPVEATAWSSKLRS